RSRGRSRVRPLSDDHAEIRGAEKGAGWISRVRLEPEPAPAVRWRPIARTRAPSLPTATRADPHETHTLFRTERQSFSWRSSAWVNGLGNGLLTRFIEL